MALLDIQAMELDTPTTEGGHGGGHGGGSQLSVALCDSVASITLCL
ncbi:MAG TPA: SapB/AmfS family lanthipeptide [Streptosporangiaceae bacterium]|nr:SapB/AmfS family lanthipeptide [Streptosporangiaceae bacterium]